MGSDNWTDEERGEAITEILSVGEIKPAIERLDRSEMEAECFTDPARGATLTQRFEKATPIVMKALEAIAKEKIAKLPDSGFTHGLFNCVDLIAGDLEYVFLKPGNWYSLPNGFVFNAEDLLKKGAKFRGQDLLGGYNAVIEGASEESFTSVSDAKRYLEEELGAIHEFFQSTGRAAIQKMKVALPPSPGDLAEIVWPGALPVSMAVEVWENGKKVTSR